MLPKIKTKSYSKWLIGRLVAIFLFVLILAFISIVVFEISYTDKVYPGVKIGHWDLGGMDYAQAQELIEQENNKIMRRGLTFYFEGQETNISAIIVSSADPGLSYKILDFKEEATLKEIFGIGRDGEWYDNLVNQFLTWRYSWQVGNQFFIDQQELFEIIKENFSDAEKEAINAKPKVSLAHEIEIIPEELGKRFDYQAALLEVNDNLASLENENIELELQTIFPQIDIQEAGKSLVLVEEVLERLPLILNYGDREWELGLADLKDWLVLEKNLKTKEAKLSFDDDLLGEYLESNIIPKINIQVRDAKLEIEDGRVVEFQSSEDGLEVNLPASVEALNKLLSEASSEAELVVDVISAKVATGDVNDLGIREIAGVGTSDFSGSPQNRRHNIARGAEILNGLLIKPDEEFSLMQALGKIDGEHGFKPELVIKGNRTIPEYGGGLCQIGTTMFRVALRSGLPITERRPHSYRVSYYEPAGMDATIYSPHPDVRFINDTGHHLLLQTEIDGNDLSFTFWGTKDGREILIDPDPPTIYNIIRPAPTKYIETLDLEPGKMKCTESSHNGATTEFNYIVTYPGGEVKKDFFKSVYVPWQAVCLVGVEELTPEEDDLDGSEQ